MIGHAEIPACLLQPPASKVKDTMTTPAAQSTHGTGNSQPPCSSSPPQSNHQWSPQGTHWSKGMPFEDAKVAVKFPWLYHVCTYCGVNKMRQLVPNPQICKNFYVTRKCTFPTCRFNTFNLR